MKFNPIPYIYYTLAVLLPIIIFGNTSEIFEINKIITIYLGATLVGAGWIIACIYQKKLLFKKSALNIPILLFLAVQAASMAGSIDARSSLLGYYGRFDGGLASSVSFSILYFGFINFMDYDKTIKFIKLLLIGGIFVAIEGFLEHFGVSFTCLALRGNITTSCWSHVQERVFSTLGQPNWLAAYLATLTPLAWLMAIGSKLKAKSIFWMGVSILFFVTLLFTKSRSGLLGYSVAFFIFWPPTLWLGFKQKRHSAIRVFLSLSTIYLILAAALIVLPRQSKISSDPANSGGTPSSQIRTIIWNGAIKIWQAHPILGTGVETFAFSYPTVRPEAHNLTTEWNFVYNKAHNEYLNYLATTGTLGLASYLLLIFISVLQISNVKFLISNKALKLKIPKFKHLLGQLEQLPARRQGGEIRSIHLAILSGYTSILITNFFGFSVTITSFLFFILPAVAFTANNKQPTTSNVTKLSTRRKLLILSCLLATGYLLLTLSGYWHADVLLASGKKEFEEGHYPQALGNLEGAVLISPNESLYHITLAQIYSQLALTAYEESNKEASSLFLNNSAKETKLAAELSPYNVNVKKTAYQIFTDLSEINSEYLLSAHQELENAIAHSPTDPSLFLSLGTNNLRIGQTADAVNAYQEAIDLKADYEPARIALARIYLSQGELGKSDEQIKYILEKVNPKNEEAIKIGTSIEKSRK